MVPKTFRNHDCIRCRPRTNTFAAKSSLESRGSIAFIWRRAAAASKRVRLCGARSLPLPINCESPRALSLRRPANLRWNCGSAPSCRRPPIRCPPIHPTRTPGAAVCFHPRSKRSRGASTCVSGEHARSDTAALVTVRGEQKAETVHEA